jgi:SAM-dependent methyltransferase
MKNLLQTFFYSKQVSNLDVNGIDLTKKHFSILKKKKLLRSAYETFYREMSKNCDKNFNVDGLEIELGSGVGFFKSIRKQIITSDIREGFDYDMSLDATDMSINANTVKCFFAINVFHHISQPSKFFNELIRVLKKGGGCILIEPHNGILSRFISNNVHKDEYFDTNEIEWDKKDKGGILSDANQALSHNIFERDKILFENIYGKNLKIIEKKYIINGLRYILSGGLNFKQLFPSFLVFVLIFLEKILKPFAKHWSPFRMIIIKKIS